MMNHVVRTYNLSGKFMYEAHFKTADEAYAEYHNIIENAKKTLPSGYGITVVRYSDEKIMATETIAK